MFPGLLIEPPNLGNLFPSRVLSCCGWCDNGERSWGMSAPFFERIESESVVASKRGLVDKQFLSQASLFGALRNEN